MAKKVNFTKTVINGLPWSRTKISYYSDSETRHLRLVISTKGNISYQVYMKCNGIPTKRTIGTYPNLPPDMARKAARELIAQLTLGIDPYKDKQIEKTNKADELTYADIWADYIKMLEDKAQQKPKTAKANIRQYHSIYKTSTPLHNMRLSEITTDYLVDFHRCYSFDRGSKIAANNIIGQIRACFNYAGVENNPAMSIRVKMNRKRKRTRYLKPDELKRFIAALTVDRSEAYRDVFLLMLTTGSRVGAVMGMEWSEINLQDGLWEPITKSSEDADDPTLIGLPSRAVELLTRRQQYCDPKNPWVFPATSESGHCSQPQSAFKRILKRAGITGVTPHDLRRTAASYLSHYKGTPSDILTLLGNKSISTVTIYAQRNVNIVKSHYDEVLDKMLD